MTVTARLLSTVVAPLEAVSADAPEVTHRPGRRLMVQRGDDELVVRDLEADGPADVCFPAPWPRRFGEVAVSPEGDVAVFAGVHAVRAVESSGATRWEVRHGCWGGACSLVHTSFAQYADDEDHRYPDSGSAAFSVDGKLVWAHVRGPLSAGGESDDDQELWLVLDAADGSVLGRARTMTVGSASYHTPHPDPAQMGLSVGEGEEGSPVLWGRWDGQRLSVRKVDDELLLQDVSPSGRRLLAVDIGQYTLYPHAADDGTVLGELDAEGTVPPHPGSSGGDRVYWDCEAAFVDEDTVVAGTSGCDAGFGTVRHWLVDARTMTLLDEISYPFPAFGPVRSAGDGRWYTVSGDGASVCLWELPAVPGAPDGS
ncbi:hypothetical protein CGZ69_24175 [Streptomyces peucetius subsp. caesius ATCC 27952]|nr:hypothetical protein CGZ69_24175 [Streptomyces peucetius subsp. caesius ATCC 27952]